MLWGGRRTRANDSRGNAQCLVEFCLVRVAGLAGTLHVSSFLLKTTNHLYFLQCHVFNNLMQLWNWYGAIFDIKTEFIIY